MLSQGIQFIGRFSKATEGIEASIADESLSENRNLVIFIPKSTLSQTKENIEVMLMFANI